MLSTVCYSRARLEQMTEVLGLEFKTTQGLLLQRSEKAHKYANSLLQKWRDVDIVASHVSSDDAP